MKRRRGVVLGELSALRGWSGHCWWVVRRIRLKSGHRRRFERVQRLDTRSVAARACACLRVGTRVSPILVHISSASRGWPPCIGHSPKPAIADLLQIASTLGLPASLTPPPKTHTPLRRSSPPPPPPSPHPYPYMHSTAGGNIRWARGMSYMRTYLCNGIGGGRDEALVVRHD